MAEEIIGLIGGTGLGDAIACRLTKAKIRNVDTPFGKPSGAIIVGMYGNKRIAFINRHGEGHKLQPSEIPYAANIFAMKKLGVRAIIASGAVGSLKEEICPRDVVIVDQFIDKTFRRQGSFFGGVGAIHCEMGEPVCGRLREILLKAGKAVDVRVHKQATYVCMEGPQFSTRAESLMHRGWGGEVIGMTAMPEAKLAREAQMCYALVALVSDYDCWREHDGRKDKQTLLQEIMANLGEATKGAAKLIEAALEDNGRLSGDSCECRSSLKLAVWTADNRIGVSQKKKLGVLFK